MPSLTRRQFASGIAGAVALSTLPMASAARAQTAPELSAEQAQRDLRILKRALTELHPALFRYSSPDQLDWLAATLAASVRCGHTWASRYNQRADVNELLFQRADKLPLTLRWLQGRALVTGSIAPGVSAADELLAINGQPVEAIVRALLPALRADGVGASAEGKRLAQLATSPTGGAMDRLFPLRWPPVDGRYRVTVRTGNGPARTATLAAVTLAARDAALPPPAPDWQLRRDGDVAILTLPTFAFWQSRFDWRAFIAQSFETIRDTPYLIIDQRRNEGGDDTIGRALLAHVLRAPYTQPTSRAQSAYERVPYVLARFLDTWNFDFFDRTGKVTRGPDAGPRIQWLLPEQAPRRIEPVAQPYRGRTLVLVGPENSSAGFLFARDLKASGAATLIGQTTGGNQRGLNGGELAWVTLPHSGVGVDIPLLAHVVAGHPPEGGVVPDIVVPPSFADTAAGIDTEMQAALQQLRTSANETRKTSRAGLLRHQIRV
jgi:hypothetical protein